MNHRTRIHVGVLLMATGLLAADEPGWWTGRGVVREGESAHDYHPVNQGQVKWMAAGAAVEFAEKLPGAGHTNLVNQVDGFPAGNNYRPANLGMLKAVAQPFYDRLIEEGYALEYPWTGKTPRDYALANRGQLKQLFCFDLDAFDTDGNGLPDWWESRYGLMDSNEDPDGDGLTNLQEYQAGSDPLFAEYQVPSGENAPVGDGSVNPPSGSAMEVLSLNGAAVSSALGTWVLDDSAVYAAGRRGTVSYTIEAPRADIFRIEVQVAQQRVLSAAARGYRLRFAMDGEFVAFRNVILSGAQQGVAVFDTPFLDAGSHTVDVLWDNFQGDVALRVEQVRVMEYAGADVNGNGFKDWVENRLMARNTIDRAPSFSRTSPVCLEGRGLFVSAMRVNGTARAVPGPDDRWFADLPLNADGSATGIAVAFENGGRLLNREVRWRETNLLTEPLVNEQLRKGDALRLCATLPGLVSGSSEIKVNGVPLAAMSADQAAVYRFEQAGEYVIEGAVSGVDGEGQPLSFSRQGGAGSVRTY